MKNRVLVVDDEKVLRFTFQEFLAEAGYEVVCAQDYDDAVEKLAEYDIDVVFSDILLGGMTGIDLLQEIKRRGLSAPVVMITGFPDIDTATRALRLGAFDYIRKPVEQDDLIRVAAVALRFKKSLDEKEEYRENLEAIFRSVKEGLISVNKDLNVLEVNRAAINICGLKKDPTGKPFHPETWNCCAKCLNILEKTLSTEKGVDAEWVECRKADRPAQVVSITTSPLFDFNGRFKGAVMVVSDETRMAELERDLGVKRKFKNIIGKSEGMQQVFSLIESLANVDTTVLISGESGTGKELVAESLYLKSDRRNTGPFITVNCAAIPENLIESELFGHEKGAFTGAVSRQIGKFEMADKGVIFLDEIGDMSLSLQSKLLRVLQKSEFHRVGGREKIFVNVRVIAATNKDLAKRVKQGEFREDLYYRLKVMELELPPLRERKTDIPELMTHFLAKFNKQFNKKIEGISSDVHKVFIEYSWPGNVRELEHAVEHAAILCSSGAITLDHLPKELRGGPGDRVTPLDGKSGDEKISILQTLEKTRWNKAKAAKLLGIDRSTLYRKMERHGIKD